MTDRKKTKLEKESKVKTFPIPFYSGEITGKITLTTDTTSRISKEELINRAFRLHSQGKILEAEKYYRIFCNEGYEDSEVFNNYGVILREKGELEKALINVNNSIRLKPEFALAYSNLGSIYRDFGRLNEAEKSTLKAIEIDNNFAEAYLNLGYILNDMGRLKEAKISIEKSIKCNPKLMHAYASLSTTLIDLGQKDESINCLKKALIISPKSEIICLNHLAVTSSSGDLLYCSCINSQTLENPCSKSCTSCNLPNRNVSARCSAACKRSINFALSILL